ncbi:MAG TPA: P-loop NTPase [Micromonosporaceae bacterium]|nr:P-loop NTPase [Micromonosporaceae bacterium]
MSLYYEPNPERVRSIVSALGVASRAAESLTELSHMVTVDRAVQLVVLGSGVSMPDALAFARQQRLARPSLGVVLLREGIDVAVLAEAIRAGVREVVNAADGEALEAACTRSLDVSRQLGGGVGTEVSIGTDCKLITVFAGKGGCGKSTMSTNLAVALNAGGTRRVLLIDLDLSFGDVAIMLQLAPERSMVDAVGMAGRLDETGLRSLLTPFLPGLDTLVAPSGPADGERVTRDLVTEILRVARRSFDYIVVDTPPFFSDQVLAAMDVSNFFVLLTTPDIPSLKNLRLTLDMFDLLEYGQDQRIIVLNRSDSRVGPTKADIERVVRSPIKGYVPSTRDVPVSINRGVPLMLQDPDHPVSRAIREIGETQLGATPAPERSVAQPAASKRSFSLRFGR